MATSTTTKGRKASTTTASTTKASTQPGRSTRAVLATGTAPKGKPTLQHLRNNTRVVVDDKCVGWLPTATAATLLAGKPVKVGKARLVFDAKGAWVRPEFQAQALALFKALGK